MTWRSNAGSGNELRVPHDEQVQRFLLCRALYSQLGIAMANNAREYFYFPSQSAYHMPKQINTFLSDVESLQPTDILEKDRYPHHIYALNNLLPIENTSPARLLFCKERIEYDKNIQCPFQVSERSDWAAFM